MIATVTSLAVVATIGIRMRGKGCPLPRNVERSWRLPLLVLIVMGAVPGI
jgi:hypothetical protein